MAPFVTGDGSDLRKPQLLPDLAPDGGSPYESRNYDIALAALRTLDPRVLTDTDPSPHRDIVFGIHASEMSGRCSVSSEVREELGLA